MTITRIIDTSSFQDPTPTTDPTDDIDWAAVERTAFDVAVVRLTMGRTTDDVVGLRDLAGALADGIPLVGGYGVVGTAEPVEDGASRLVNRAARVADPGRFFFMLDAENFGDGSHPTIGQVDRYARRLHDLTGRWPVAYVPGWWLTEHGYSVAGLDLRHCPWAQSHYVGAPWTDDALLAVKPTNLRGFDRLAWLQFTSSGVVPGIDTRVDLNAAYVGIGQLATMLGVDLGGDMPLDDTDVTKVATAVGAMFRVSPDKPMDIIQSGQANNVKAFAIIAQRLANVEAKIDATKNLVQTEEDATQVLVQTEGDQTQQAIGLLSQGGADAQQIADAVIAGVGPEVARATADLIGQKLLAT